MNVVLLEGRLEELVKVSAEAFVRVVNYDLVVIQLLEKLDVRNDVALGVDSVPDESWVF
eukprot:CAMPEP_0204911754 /NCGR_PEP_ID=MMETSP1397-20131031/10033_1 /ASSEMBLY_ACC=CAM_ASM_000891 /TAXON_ID=49980 /ORGANISM="Climacostomum Climacostomum virens, Strain Stock W-24" /LENGTH=58 /DNA_ID=CAMNT_0052082419 /DNA_START=191 /DNA_END=364 /DNA_ORIENTATION=-